MLRPILRSLSIVTLAFLTASQAHADFEALTNGNFESFTTGVPTGWTYSQGLGPSSTKNTAHVSPFTNVYPAGTASFDDYGDSTSTLAPILSQQFASVTKLTYSFDFDMLNEQGGTTRVDFSGGSFQPAVVYIDRSGYLDVFAQGGFETAQYYLSPNTWYDVSGSLNIAANTFSLTIKPYNGTADLLGTWELFPYNQTASSYINEVSIDDIASGNSTPDPIAFDNFSIIEVPEPSVLLAMSCGLVVLGGWRQFRLSLR